MWRQYWGQALTQFDEFRIQARRPFRTTLEGLRIVFLVVSSCINQFDCEKIDGSRFAQDGLVSIPSYSDWTLLQGQKSL